MKKVDTIENMGCFCFTELGYGNNAPKMETTATYDKEMEKGLYTGHFSWNNQTIPVDKDHGDHAKIFEFNPKVLDGGKNKDK